MKHTAFALLLSLLPGCLLCQQNDTVLDSLKRPLPVGATIQAQAVQLKNILQYILYQPEIGFGDYPGKLDSLNRCCIAGKTGDWRFEMWVEAVSAYYSNANNFDHYEEGTRILEKAMRQFELVGDSNMIGAIIPDLCYYAQSLGDSIAFNKYHQRALGVAPHMDDLFLHWRLLLNLGISCKKFGKYADGLTYFFEAYDLVEKENTAFAFLLQREILRYICISYREFNEFDTALFYLEKSIQSPWEDRANDSEYYFTLADLYCGKKDYRKALEAYQLTKLMPDEPIYKQYNSDILASKAECFRRLGDPKTGLLFAQKAAALFPNGSQILYSGGIFRELAECELAAGMTNLALKHGLFAHEASLIGKNTVLIFKSADLLSRIYKAKNNFKKAFEFSVLAFKYYDQTKFLQNGQQIAGKTFERNNAIKIARREAEVQAQLTQQRNIRYALFAGLGILVLLTFLLYNRYRLKQRTTEQLEAKNHEVEAARSRAEASEAFKSRFLANMSHEIRTPLHGISGFTDLLLETSLSEKQRRWLSSIHHSTDRLGEVVNDILDLSKLEAGEVKLRQIPFSPARVAADVQDALSLRAEQKGIELRLHMDENIPEAVTGDPTRLYQILMNLAGNAVKFTEQGSVTLAVERLAIDRVTGSHPVNSQPLNIPAIQFKVTDTGIGIPAEKLASIFDSFQQAGEDTTARFGGTGLGLTIARELVHLYGSDIQVASELGKGSTFSFVLTLPLADAEDLETKSAKNDTLHFTQPLRILLADDNSLNLEIATEAIRRHFENAVIVEARNGKEAVAQFQSGAFDLILMDMQMPEMTGTEATRYIRQQLASDISIIALTASATPEEIENALESGMNRHLGKPFKPRELAQVVAEVLGLDGSVPAALAAGKTQDPTANKEAKISTPSLPAAKAAGTDLAFLRDFCDGDEVQMRHFIQKFLDQYPLELQRLEAALQQGDREAIYQTAHSFRPQLEFVGLKSAADKALQIERGAREGLPFSTLLDLMKQIKTALEDLPIAEAW